MIKMKHTRKTALTAALLTASVSLSACNGGCSPQTVYGPPPAYEPSTEEIQDVYGPPVVQEDTTIASTSNNLLTDVTTSEQAIEGKNTSTKAVDMQLVYGPPSAVDD